MTNEEAYYEVKYLRFAEFGKNSLVVEATANGVPEDVQKLAVAHAQDALHMIQDPCQQAVNLYGMLYEI